MGLCAFVRNDLEHVLDERCLPRLWREVAYNPVLCVCAVLAA
jgi:hypothetical protein